MNIGVIGKGKLGKRLIDAGYKSIECNLLDEKSMNTLNGFDVVINCAGKHDLSWCEDNPVECYDINVYGLERLLRVFQGKIIHISCDTVFDGILGFYGEMNNQFLPLNRLAQCKYFQEMLILNRKKDWLIIRTSELYDVDTRNIQTLLKRIDDNRPISGANDMFFTPTYIPHLVIAVKELIERNLDGIINIAGRDYCTESEMNKMFCEKYGYNDFIDAGITHRNKSVRQPKRLGLDVTKADNIKLPLFSLEEGMEKLCLQLKS